MDSLVTRASVSVCAASCACSSAMAASREAVTERGQQQAVMRRSNARACRVRAGLFGLLTFVCACETSLCFVAAVASSAVFRFG